MSTSLDWLSLLVGLGFYVYYAWIRTGVPRSAKDMAQVAGLMWTLTAAYAGFVWFWGATRGLTASQTFLGDLPHGSLQNRIGTVRSLAVLATFFSIHVVVRFLVRHEPSADIDS